MNSQTITAKLPSDSFLLTLVLLFASGAAFSQVPVDENGNPIAVYEQDREGGKSAPGSGTALASAELQELVGPVALYPDDLLAIVLPAATYPLEIVQAARFIERLETDSSLQPDEDWDESIVALLNYPDVIRMMDEEIDWTWRLGDAVIAQQSDVIAAVEAFRDRAYAAGNLKTDDYQTVSNDDGIIEIEPVSDEIIYVPYYEPAEVVVYQPRRVYYYYPDPYPVYYYPYPSGHHFRSGYFWGVTTAFSIGWSNHYLHVYHPSYRGHPYYGYTYYSHYYRSPSINVYNSWYVNNNYYSSGHRHRDGDYWRPRSRAGSRQHEPRVNNYHYPPGGDQGGDRYTAGRDQFDNRNNGHNGRMNLNLRERNESDRGRIAANSNFQGRVARGSASSRRPTSSNRGTDNTPARNQTGASGRSRVTANNSGSSQQRVRDDSRENSSRPAIQLRDRSTDTGAANLRASSRPQITRPTQQRSTATLRSSGPSVQQRAPAPRSTGPRSSGPRRSSVPSASAPTRSSAPRAAAPSPTPSQGSSAPGSSRSSSASGGRSSSGRGSAGSSQSRRSSSSRPRNN